MDVKKYKVWGGLILLLPALYFLGVKLNEFFKPPPPLPQPAKLHYVITNLGDNNHCDTILTMHAISPVVSKAEGIPEDAPRAKDTFYNCSYYYLNDTLILDFGTSVDWKDKFLLKLHNNDVYMQHVNTILDEDKFKKPTEAIYNVDTFSLKIDTSYLKHTGDLFTELVFSYHLDYFMQNQYVRGHYTLNNCIRFRDASAGYRL